MAIENVYNSNKVFFKKPICSLYLNSSKFSESLPLARCVCEESTCNPKSCPVSRKVLFICGYLINWSSMLSTSLEILLNHTKLCVNVKYSFKD